MAILAAYLLVGTLGAQAPKIVGVLLRVKGTVLAEKNGEAATTPKSPFKIYSDTRIVVSEKSKAFVFNGRRVEEVGAGQWPKTALSKSAMVPTLVEKLVVFASGRKKFYLTGIRGFEPSFSKPTLVAFNLTADGPERRFKLLYVVNKAKAPLVRISSLSDGNVKIETPSRIFAYEENEVYAVTVRSDFDRPVVALDCGVIRGIPIELSSSAPYPEQEVFAPSLESLLAQSDLLAALDLSASAIESCFLAFEFAKDSHEKEMIDEQLWVILQHVGSGLADLHLRKTLIEKG